MWASIILGALRARRVAAEWYYRVCPRAPRAPRRLDSRHWVEVFGATIDGADATAALAAHLQYGTAALEFAAPVEVVVWGALSRELDAPPPAPSNTAAGAAPAPHTYAHIQRRPFYISQKVDRLEINDPYDDLVGLWTISTPSQ